MTTRIILGQTIEPCEYAPGEHKGRWAWRRDHNPTGIPWSDENCRHFQTLGEARECIGEWLRLENSYR